MDSDQQQRFAEAVERKKDEAEARSRETGAGHPGSEDLPGDQAPRFETGRPQDEASIRDKGSRHKKVTADKWNQ